MMARATRGITTLRAPGSAAATDSAKRTGITGSRAAHHHPRGGAEEVVVLRLTLRRSFGARAC
ncbi:MAG TPA: hypothetical protein VGB92_13280 [Longimicrobium sp.]